MVCCTGNEIETRLEELEVKVNTMSKIQVNVLNTIKRLETYCYFTPTSQVYSNYHDSYMPWNTTQSQYFYQTTFCTAATAANVLYSFSTPAARTSSVPRWTIFHSSTIIT